MEFLKENKILVAVVVIILLVLLYKYYYTDNFMTPTVSLHRSDLQPSVLLTRENFMTPTVSLHRSDVQPGVFEAKGEGFMTPTVSLHRSDVQPGVVEAKREGFLTAQGYSSYGERGYDIPSCRSLSGRGAACSMGSGVR